MGQSCTGCPRGSTATAALALWERRGDALERRRSKVHWQVGPAGKERRTASPGQAGPRGGRRERVGPQEKRNRAQHPEGFFPFKKNSNPSGVLWNNWQRNKSHKNVIHAQGSFYDFTKLVWTNLVQLKSVAFEFKFKWISATLAFSKGWKMHVKSWKGLEGKKNELCQVWEGGESWSHCKNQTVPFFSPQHAFEIKFKWSSNTDSTIDHHMKILHLASCQVWNTMDEAKLQHE